LKHPGAQEVSSQFVKFRNAACFAFNSVLVFRIFFLKLFKTKIFATARFWLLLACLMCAADVDFLAALAGTV
jgi:hypothetical protein